MVNLERKFRSEGITPRYLSGVLPELSLPPFSAEEEGGLGYAVEEIPIGIGGRGISSLSYKITLHGASHDVALFVKEPRKVHALYGNWVGEMENIGISPANYEHGFLKHLRIPSVLHRSGATERIIMPYYSNGSLQRMFMNEFSKAGVVGRSDQLSDEVVYQCVEDVLHALLETSLRLVPYKTRDAHGKLLVAKMDLPGLRERVTQYFAALLTIQKGISNGKMGGPLDIAREAGRVYAKSSDELSSILEYLAEGKVVVHGDCRPENILVKVMPDKIPKNMKGGQMYDIVDWGGARLGHVNSDLVTLFNSYELSLFGISHPDSEHFSRFAEMLYGAMACNYKIWTRIVDVPEKIEFHATEQEREDNVSECQLLRIWDSLNRAGVYSLSFLQYPQENKEFLESIGDKEVRALYSPEIVINTYLRTLSRVCNEMGFRNIAEIGQNLLIRSGPVPNGYRGRNPRQKFQRNSLEDRMLDFAEAQKP